MNSNGAVESSRRGDEGFDPGASFVDHAPAQSGSAKLPSWLQNFAEVAGHDTPPSPEASTQRPANAAPQPGGSAKPAQPSASSSTNFFNDDDLPEWLRALSLEQPVEAEEADPSPPVEEVVPGFSVPSTSRAWVSGHEAVDAAPGGSLFAAITQAVDLRPDADASEARVMGSTSAAGVLSASQPGRTPVQAATGISQPDSESKRVSVWLLAAVVVILALVIILVGR